MGCRGGIRGTERWEEDNARGRVWARRSKDEKDSAAETKEEEPEAFGTISSFLNCLFASVNLKILFCREVISDS